MFDFHEKVLAGLKTKNSFSTYIYGDDKEMADLEIQNKIISAMYDEEKAKGYFDSLSRKEIAKVAGVRGSEVSDTIRKFKHMRSFHNWLLRRQQQGDEVPESRDELNAIYRLERPAFLFKDQKEKQKKMRYNKKAL